MPRAQAHSLGPSSLSRDFGWTREGVRASPFARAFLARCGLDGG